MKYRSLIFLLGILVLFWGCNDDYIPKPVGLFRIDIPEHGYKNLDIPDLPYAFDYADYATVEQLKDKNPDWINIYYPLFKAKIYFSYTKMDTSLSKYINDCHNMAYKHTAMATNIETEPIILPKQKVFGLIYYIEGDKAASPINFYLTDSTNHFVRGALYFNLEPRNDSLQPVIQSIDKDIDRMIKTFKWK